MPQPTPEALEAAVKALYRIRAVERPADEEGLREVWHQCALGADLLTCVDAQGHVVRQELMLLEDFFRWTSRDVMATGSVSAPERSRAGPAPDNLRLDPKISRERVLRATRALKGYQGADRYIRNINRLLNMVAEGLQSFDAVTVTRSPSQAHPIPMPRVEAGPGRAAGGKSKLLAAVVALLAAAGLLALLLR